jgi:pilus assembly protein Flp/PilA
MLSKLWSDESGQGMTEYILIIALIAVVCVVAIKAFGAQIKDLISRSTRKIKDDTAGFDS